jgi:hypothetical protein
MAEMELLTSRRQGPPPYNLVTEIQKVASRLLSPGTALEGVWVAESEQLILTDYLFRGVNRSVDDEKKLNEPVCHFDPCDGSKILWDAKLRTQADFCPFIYDRPPGFTMRSQSDSSDLFQTGEKYYVDQDADEIADELWRQHGGINTFINSRGSEAPQASKTQIESASEVHDTE